MNNNPKKHTLEKAKAIIAAGAPTASERLPELVTWLSDQNSPGYSEIAEFLPSLGHIVVTHIKEALKKTDNLGEWQSAILFTQVRHWPREWLVEIEGELDELAWHGSSNWDVDIDAASILVKNHLGNRDNLQMLITRQKKHAHSRLKKLNELEQQMQMPLSNEYDL
jgi:hypothetical protein